MKTIQAGQFKIEGESVSGLGTCIAIPQLDIVFDIGYCPPLAAIQCQTVLITHAHIDHMGSAHLHAASRALKAMSPTKFIVPASIAEGLKELLELWAKLQHQIVSPHEIIPMVPGEVYELRKGVFVTPFKTNHRIDSQGYRVFERRSKLRPEFKHLSGPEIAELRKNQGVDITEVTEATLVVYTGDTRPSIWDTIPEILNAEVVITEATYLDETKVPANADQWGHTHLDDLVARAEKFANVKHLVLTHFSAQYTPEVAARIVREKMGPNVLPL